MAQITINLPDDWSVEAHGFQLNTDRLEEINAAGGIAYLLANGFTQSISDAGAMAKDERTDEAVAARRAARFNAIMAGEVGTTGGRGPRVTGLDAVMRDVAVERLRAAFAKAKKSWPDGKGSAAKIADLVKQLLAHATHGPAIRAEAERRMAETPDADPDAIADLLA